MRNADWLLALGVLALAACEVRDDWQPIPSGGETISAPPVLIGLLHPNGMFHSRTCEGPFWPCTFARAA